MSACVFCSTFDNLNTQMTITVDGLKITVDICDAHAEDASLKTVKDAYFNRQNEIDKVKEAARKLGIIIPDSATQGSLIIPTSIKEPQKEEIKPQTKIITENVIDINPSDILEDGFISSSIVDNAKGMVSVGGSTSHGNIPSHSSINVKGFSEDTKQLADKTSGKVKMAVFSGRGGAQLSLPEVTVNGLGTTRLRIANVDNDARLQGRFKRMVQESAQDRQPDFIYQGYSEAQVTCTLCRGEQNIKTKVGGKIQSTMCPKCNGSGTISKY